MEELKNKFSTLSKREKVEFMKEIMPEVCNMFREDPQGMMRDMMPYCKEMMKDCDMEMPMMAAMMNNMTDYDQ